MLFKLYPNNHCFVPLLLLLARTLLLVVCTVTATSDEEYYILEPSTTNTPAKQVLSLLLERTPKPGGVTLKIKADDDELVSSERPYLQYGLLDEKQSSSTIFPTFFALERKDTTGKQNGGRKVTNPSARTSRRSSDSTSFTAPILEKRGVRFQPLQASPSLGHFYPTERTIMQTSGVSLAPNIENTYEKLGDSASISSSEEFVGSEGITGSSYMIRTRDIVQPNYIMGGFLRREIWTIPVLVFGSINILLVILFEIYVLCRAKGQSRRHLFLGQMLLFALFLSSSLALIFAMCPSLAGCYLSRLVIGIAYSLIFSVLLVKCVFLLSLNKGIYLPASYQGFLLFFCVMVQVAIDIQWTVLDPPNFQGKYLNTPLLEQCGTSYMDFLLSLSYNGLLIFIVGILALKAKSIRENFRESLYITFTIVVSIPVWIAWITAGWILKGTNQDACIATGLIVQSLATFLIMFMPKGRQLAAMGKEGMYLEDQEDQCSGYSPSFFHFKPTKGYKAAFFGDGNLYTTLEPTISTINPNVFFHRSDLHSGMIY